jgi:serine acetyltransferase
MLVAPVEVGARGATGAGSVVTHDVPEDALAVGIPARIIKGRGNKMRRRASDPPPNPRQ